MLVEVSAQLKRRGQPGEAGSDDDHLLWTIDHVDPPLGSLDSIVPQIVFSAIGRNYPTRSVAGTHTTTVAYNDTVVATMTCRSSSAVQSTIRAICGPSQTTRRVRASTSIRRITPRPRSSGSCATVRCHSRGP